MIEQGDIWWTDLPDAEGSRPARTRPVLVIQSDSFNDSRIATVVCVILTRTLRLASAPGNVLLKVAATGLETDSVANVSQIVTLNKGDLRDHVQKLKPKQLGLVLSGIDVLLGREALRRR